MLLDRHRVIGAPFNGSVICHDDAFLSLNQPYAGHNASRGRAIIVHIPGGHGAKFQKRRIGIAEKLDTFARQQLIAFAMLRDSILTSALLDLLNIGLKLIQELLEIARILLEFLAAAINM